MRVNFDTEVSNISKYIILSSTEKGYSISNLRLQKLLYFIQGASYQNFDKPLFEAEFEAWHYGPVVREIYAQYAHKGASQLGIVDVESFLFDSDEKNWILKVPTYDDLNISSEKRVFIDLVLKRLKDIDDFELVKRSHKPGSPWAKVYNKNNIEVIKESDIKNYFEMVRK